MSALSHVLMPQTHANSGSQAGQIATAGQVLPNGRTLSNEEGSTANQSGHSQGQAFAELISAQTGSAQGDAPLLPLANADTTTPIPNRDVAASALVMDTNYLTSTTFASDDADMDVTLTAEFLTKADTHIIAETPVIADIADIEPQTIASPGFVVATDAMAKVDAPIIAETADIANTSTIEPDLFMMGTRAVAEGKTTGPIIAETPAIAGLPTIEPGRAGSTAERVNVAATDTNAKVQITPIAEPSTLSGPAVIANNPAITGNADVPAEGAQTPSANKSPIQPVSPDLVAEDSRIHPQQTTEAAETSARSDARQIQSTDAAEVKTAADSSNKTSGMSAAASADPTKISDVPSAPALTGASTDSTAPIKSLPAMASASTLAPVSGFSERMAATILQTTNAPTTVTVDKIPQAVVAIALSAKSATLQIDPPELGRIQLDYQFDTQGRTVVTLTPESEAARAALMERMAVITAALEQGSNSPIDVKLGEARDFGAAFGQASQDGEQSGSDNGSQDGQSGAGHDNAHAQALQQFTRAPAGEPDRLHILV